MEESRGVRRRATGGKGRRGKGGEREVKIRKARDGRGAKETLIYVANLE